MRATSSARFKPSPPVVLTFAGFDPSGGAGISADIMTLSALGCHALSVVTALTVQDSARVSQISPVDRHLVNDQAREVLEDMAVDAFKIGMIGSVENCAIIAEIMADYPDIPLILDPVLASGGGDEFVTEELIEAINDLLVPQTTVLTPNSMEARRLAHALMGDTSNAEWEDLLLEHCAAQLLEAGSEFVLITGTHENTGEVINSLYRSHDDDDAIVLVRQDAWTRLPGSYHGSGCTLAAALAASLANGMEISQAVRDAQEFTWNTLKWGFRPGMGQAIPDRFFWAREAADELAADEAAQAAAAAEPAP